MTPPSHRATPLKLCDTEPEKITRWLLAGHIDKPRDSAGVAVLFCSDTAGDLSGQSIVVQGGLTLN